MLPQPISDHLENIIDRILIVLLHKMGYPEFEHLYFRIDNWLHRILIYKELYDVDNHAVSKHKMLSKSLKQQQHFVEDDRCKS